MSGEDAPRPCPENLIVLEIKTNKQTQGIFVDAVYAVLCQTECIGSAGLSARMSSYAFPSPSTENLSFDDLDLGSGVYR
jgi:hypothetical protein